MTEVHYPMPSLGEGMTDGKVLEWYVTPGQVVRRGAVVGLVDTEKGAIEIEIWEDATILEVLAPPGSRVPVGDPLLRMGPAMADGDEEATAVETASAEAVLPASPPAPAASAPPVSSEGVAPSVSSPPTRAAVASVPPVIEGGERIRASPAARRRAAELGIDLADVKGSGPAGAILLEDVPVSVGKGVGQGTTEGGLSTPHRVTPVAQRAAELLGVDVDGIAGTGPAGTVRRIDVEGAAAAATAGDQPGDEDGGAARNAAMRRAIAAAMTRSKREIPHYYLQHTVSVEGAICWLEGVNRDRPPAERILPAALHLRAVALALGDYPSLNGFWEGDAFSRGAGVHLGVVVSLRRGGIVAPAILDADRKPLGELSAALVDLVRRARSGRLKGSEATGATITVTSMGDRGVETVFGVIYPPQVAIVGAGRIVERPWAEGGMIGVRRVLRLTLSADHRASDGHIGGLFLERVGELLQHPEEL